MSDEYQLRKDVDRLIDDIYGVNRRIVAFSDDSQLRGISTDEFNAGTIDALFERYHLTDGSGGGGGDLSDYFTKEEINTILSSYVTSATLEDYQPLLLSGENIKTINGETILGQGNIHISGGSTDIVTSWGNPTSDEKVPSEKLAKTTLDEKVNRSELHNLDINLTTLELVPKSTNPNGVICFEDKGSKYIEKSNTSGLVKNDGTIDTTQYLSSLPSHNHDDRYYTESEVDTALNGKQATLVSGTNIKTVNNESLLGSGNLDISSSSQNVFYGTCSTSSSTQTKVVSVDDWSFTTGNILFVKFSNVTTYDGTARISIDGTVKDITSVGTTKTSQYRWRAGELVGFVYDGTNMLMLEGGLASTSYYGVTKLSNDIDSTSTSLSATPKAVKTAYDLADSKQDELVSGTNIKTINNQSLLGSGNIDIQGGGGSVIGTGSFSINNQGHLIVELPNAIDNPYFIDNQGHLIYDTSNTHNGS